MDVMPSFCYLWLPTAMESQYATSVYSYCSTIYKLEEVDLPPFDLSVVNVVLPLMSLTVDPTGYEKGK